MASHSFAEQLAALQSNLAAIPVDALQSNLDAAINTVVHALSSGKPVVICGNGGSAADAQHISGELVGKFLKERRALNVRALSTDSRGLRPARRHSLGDFHERQLEERTRGRRPGQATEYGSPRNVGRGRRKLAGVADILPAVPSTLTPHIQETHIMLYHYICEHVEARFT